MTVPRSQKAEVRPIGFLLQDLGNRTNDLSWVRFNIRPEELNISEPSRANVQQTLGGAWLDNWGPGIKQVTINGHTGWRARYGEEDGFALFRRLRSVVYANWHEKRAAAIDAGRNPDLVQLVFVDELNERIYLVAPMTFNLRRSRSRPLLMQYQINLTVLSDTVDVDTSVIYPPEQQPQDEQSLDDIAQGADKITPESPEPSKSVVDSLRDSVKRLQEMAEDVDSLVDRTIGQPTKAFMDATNEVLSVTTETVSGIKGAIDTSTQSLLTTALNLSQAGRNIGQTIAALNSLPGSAKARFMEIAGAYGNAFCVLSNAFDSGQYYPDYTGLYGASYCSSTAGGTPLSAFRDENPLYRVSPVTAPSPVTVTTESQSAIGALTRLDVLSATPDTDLMSRVSSAANGISVQEVA